MALIGSLSRDVVMCIIPYIDVPDILNVSLGNRTIYSRLFPNESIWRQYVIQTAADDSWAGIKMNDISWKELVQLVRMRLSPELRKTQTGIHLSMELRKIHLRRRFATPPASRDFLRLFLEVITDNPKIPTLVIPGTEVPYSDLDELKVDKSEMTFAFAPKDGSTFLLWQGEGDNFSTYSCYGVDRQSTSNRVYMSETDVPYRLFKKIYSSTLSKKDYATVGQVLHNDPQFYEGISSSKYNWATGHSYHRSGNAPTGIASSTSSIDRPDLRIQCITKIIVTYSVNALYQMFIRGIKLSDLTYEHMTCV